MAQAKYSFTHSEICCIPSLASRHPYFIQRTCYFLLEAKRLHKSDKIDLNDVQKQVYDDLPPMFRHVHTMLKKQELGLKQPTKERRELNESLLFHNFMQEVGLIQDVELTLEELETVLAILHDSYALGESGLRLLKIVSTQTQHIVFPSSSDTVKAIRTELQKVLERMQGNGTRQGNAPRLDVV